MTIGSLRELLAGFAEVPAAADRPITGLASNSRQVRPGDLFLAVRGLHRHGLQHLSEACRAGAVAVAWEPPFAGELPPLEVPLLKVENLGRELGALANRFYAEPSQDLAVIGVTGTNGKTSCTHFVAQSLSEAEIPCGLVGTLGYGVYGRLTAGDYTTPGAVTLQRLFAELRAQGVRRVAMEVSSHALAQRRIAGTRFAVAVLTNLTRDHLDYHGTLEAYAAAKRELFLDYRPRSAVLNADDPFGRELIAALSGRIPVVTYSLDARPLAGAFVWGEVLELLPAGGLRLRVVSSWGEGELCSPLLGRFNAVNLLAALATLLALEMPFGAALERVSRVSPVPGRMQRFGGGGRPLAVVDYAHTPDALEQALETLRGYTRGRLWCVFGCGGDRDRGKRPQMGAAAERNADRVIVTDDNPRTENPDAIVRDVLAGMAEPRRAEVVRGRETAIRRALAEAGPGDVVLIAGKGHEDYQLLGNERIPFSDAGVVQHWLEAAA